VALDVSAFAGQANLSFAAPPGPASERSKNILVTLLLTGLPAVAADDAFTIDIRPHQDPNVLNVNVIGWLPVAIYGDWGNVDPETVELEGVPALQWYDDKGDYLLVKFDAAAVIDTFGAVNEGDILTLWLTGALYDGTLFDASDEVVILKRGRR
jgi:hypothetical protein